MVRHVKSIAQLGPIWGTIAFAASIAAIFAMLGGFRASGGPVSAGVPYVVGERRAEVFVPSTNGTILPTTDGFSRTMPGIGASAVAGSTKPTGQILVVGDMMSAKNIQRNDPNFDWVIVDTVMRHRGDILNG